MQKQAALIEKITEALRQDKNVEAAYLSGSFGRGDADAFSDVDILVLVAQENVESVFVSLQEKIKQIEKVLYSKILPHSKTINVITQDWLRFDLTIVSQISSSVLKPLFVKTGCEIKAGTGTKAENSIKNDALTDMANEFIRVLGLMPVVMGRNELVVAQTGTNLLRDSLIRLMVHENDPQPPRGALSLSKALTPEQTAIAGSPSPTAKTCKKKWPASGVLVFMEEDAED